MDSYLDRLDQTPPSQKWRNVRGWMETEPLPLYAELRQFRPVLALPEVTLATRFSDCTAVLRQHDVFSVALYKPKQGDYWMAEDDTPRHWREKGVMQSILDLDNLGDVRRFVAQTASVILQQANGELDVVRPLCRGVPIKLVQERFGFDDSDPDKLVEWSYWNQRDAFHNQPFDSIVVDDPEAITENRKRAGKELGEYLAGLLQRRASDLQAGRDKGDPVTRLLKLSMSGAMQFDAVRVAQNVGGLLIGAVETTSHAIVNAIDVLLGRPDVRSKAVEAAKSGDASEFDGYVFEALRFKPAFPYFFRVCEKPTKLAAGTDYEHDVVVGTIVMPVTHSAMFDEEAFPNPNAFDPTRSETNMFHFGMGLHECLGRHIGREMIAETVRQVLLLPNVEALAPPDRQGGPVPESYRLRWTTTSPALA